MRAIGRTNDCVLYGGQARYTIRAEDDELAQLAERLPASASSDYGTPFYDIFKRYDNDFYKIDPMLFSPAEVWLTSATAGRRSTAAASTRRAARVALRRLTGRARRHSERRTGWHTDELCRALAHAATRRVLRLTRRLCARSAASAAAARSRTSGAAVLHADARCSARIIPSGSLEQIIFRVDALHWIEDRGVPVMNSPRAIERSVDKFYTDALLHEAGLDTPETVVCETTADALAAVRRFGDAVIKPIFGSMGHGLVRVSDPDVAFRIVRALDQVRAVFYVQRYVEHGGRDIRVFIVGGRVIGAIERRAPEGDWRTNVSRGGSATRSISAIGSDNTRSRRPRPSAPTTREWICCPRATARCTSLK